MVIMMNFNQILDFNLKKCYDETAFISNDKPLWIMEMKYSTKGIHHTNNDP